METTYEVWMERMWKNTTETVVEKNAEGHQVPVEKPVRLDGQVTEPFLGSDEAPVEYKSQPEAENVARQQINEDGIVRSFVRETRTVKEFVPAPAK